MYECTDVLTLEPNPNKLYYSWYYILSYVVCSVSGYLCMVCIISIIKLQILVVYTVVRMYGCTDVRMYGCADVRRFQLYGCTDVRMHGCADVRKYGCTFGSDAWMYGCTDVRMYGCR